MGQKVAKAEPLKSTDVRTAESGLEKISEKNQVNREVILSQPPRPFPSVSDKKQYLRFNSAKPVNVTKEPDFESLGTFTIYPVFVSGSLFNPARQYLLFLPSSLGSSFPVVYHMHGKCGSAANEVFRQRWVHTAYRKGFAVVFGQAYGQRIEEGVRDNNCLWDLAHPDDGDDIDYFVQVMTDVEQRCPGLDKSRLYVSGHSNGALFTAVLAIRFGNKIAALVNNMGGLSLSDGSLLPINTATDTEPIFYKGHGFEASLPPAGVPAVVPRPYLIITGSEDTMRDQCYFAKEKFEEAGFPVEFWDLPNQRHRWQIEREHLCWKFLVEHRNLVD